MIDPGQRTVAIVLSVAIGLVLYRAFGLRKILLAYGVLVGIVVLYIALRQIDNSSQSAVQYYTPPMQAPVSNAPRPCAKPRSTCIQEALPAMAQVQGGEIRYQSAVASDQGTLRLFAAFKASGSTPIVGDSVGRALLLARDSLCGTDELFEKLGVDPGAVTLIFYEGAERVGEIPVPSTFCA